MLLAVLRLLCVSLCSEAVAAQPRWHQTKSTFTPHYESTERNVQNGRWRALNGEDNELRHGVSAQAAAGTWLETGQPSSGGAEPLVRAAAHAGAGEEALRTDGIVAGEAQGGARGRVKPEEYIEQLNQRARTCHPRSGHRRCRRDAKHSRRGDRELRQGPAANPDHEAMAQVGPVASAPPFNQSSDYEDFTLPDLSDSTPFVPMNTRTRRPQVRNPFYPLNAEAYGAYAVMLTAAAIFAVGIIGNIAIMCIVCHNYYMRSISNSLLANLALWDFVVIFFCLPLVVFHQLTKDWLLGEFSCRIIPYLEVASLGVTTFTLCALCIDRFRAATNVRLYYEMIENCASTAAKLAVIWIGALLLALPELLIRQLVTEDGDPPDVTPCERCVVRISTELPDTLYVLGLTYDGARLWWYFGCYFCLPTLFTICSSVVTARKIRLAERVCVRGSQKQIQMESQMNCAVVALAILYGFCIIPENICNIVSVYMAAGVPRRTLDILHLVSQLLLFCKSAITPVLLFSLCQPFTRAFLDCCCCCCQECAPARASTTATAGENENENETTELELESFSTMRREASPYSAGGLQC